MFSNRINAALFLLTAALSTGTATAQRFQGPTTLAAKDSFLLTRVDPQLVVVQLEQAPKDGPFQVVAGEAEKAAKLQWHVDARCGTQLKSLSIQHPGGIKNFTTSLTPTTKGLQKTVTLQSFQVNLIAQRCLDVANTTFVTAVDAEDKHELEIQQKAFTLTNNTVTTLDGAAHGNFLLLSGLCTSADGKKTITSVSGKEHSAVLEIRCCFNSLCG